MPIRVERRRLLRRIAAGTDAGANIVALSAPPGAGKTTTLDHWLGSRRESGEVVLALPAGAHATGELWPGLLAAIQDQAPPAARPAITTALNQVVHAPSAEVGPETKELLRDLGSSLWLLVDDAHRWTDATAVRQLGRLLSAAQPAMRVAIGARYTPHGLLATRVLEGTAKEYRCADLAFDRDEARELLAAEDVALSEADLGTLLRRTEGWAAGLRLAALAMAHHDDRPAFVRDFAGTDRAVSDYLVSEVLSGLPADSIDVLLEVSVAETVDLDLARLLTGRSDAGALLAELAERNALVATVHHEPDRYELHPLLRTYLRAESRRRDEPGHRRRLAATADWFERAGDVRGAIQHAAAASDAPGVESLIPRYCSRIVMSDGPQAMRDLLRSLPPWLQSRPPVTGAAALTAAIDHNLAATDLDLTVLDAYGDDVARRRALRAISVLASARARPITRDAVTDALASLALVAGEDPDLAVLGRSLASMALATAGDLAAADESARAVAQISRSRGLDFLLFQTLSAQCAVSTFGSDFAAARVHAGEAIELANRRGWDRHPLMARFRGCVAFAAWQACDDATAAEHARSAVDAADSTADPLGAAAAQCVHDLVAATSDAGLDLAAIGHLRAYHDLWPLLPPTSVSTDACFALMVSLRAHEPEVAGAIVRRAEEVIADTPDVRVLKAMRHVYQGRDAAARQELEHVAAADLDCSTPWTTAVRWVIVAHLADVAGEPARTHDAMLNAVRLAEANHLMRGVLDAAPSVRRLLLRHRGRFGRHDDFVSDVLAYAEARHRGDAGSGLVLTGKELEILRDLPSMLSVREIADAHVVSVNTVKSHLKSVYRKLGVTSRRDAVDLARESGLI